MERREPLKYRKHTWIYYKTECCGGSWVTMVFTMEVLFELDHE